MAAATSYEDRECYKWPARVHDWAWGRISALTKWIAAIIDSWNVRQFFSLAHFKAAMINKIIYYTDLFHWPMQGPQAFARTVPPNCLKVSAWQKKKWKQLPSRLNGWTSQSNRWHKLFNKQLLKGFALPHKKLSSAFWDEIIIIHSSVVNSKLTRFSRK